MAFIYNEIPSGTIDGVNREFFLSKNPINVMNVVLDGAPYFSFSISGNKIFLDQAPTTNLRLDLEYDVPITYKDFVYNEVPVGYVNGVNTTFTLEYTPSAIINVVMDGAEYFDYGVVGNKITLNFAPQYSVRVDYEYGTTEKPGSTAGYGNTLKEIYDSVYAMLGEETDVDLFNLEKTIKPIINQVHNTICKGIVVDETTMPRSVIRASDLRFLNKKINIYNPGEGRISEATRIGDNNIKVDTVKFQDSGFVAINGNVVRYRGRTTNMLTGIDINLHRVESGHIVGSLVQQVYEIPQEALQTLQLVRETDGYILKEYDHRSNDMGDYTIITDNNLTNNRYILFRAPRNGTYTLSYRAAPLKLSNDFDKCNLPDDYGLSVLAPIVAGKVLYNTDEQGLGISFLRKGYAELSGMYMYYNQSTKPFRDRVKTKPMIF